MEFEAAGKGSSVEMHTTFCKETQDEYKSLLYGALPTNEKIAIFEDFKPEWSIYPTTAEQPVALQRIAQELFIEKTTDAFGIPPASCSNVEGRMTHWVPPSQFSPVDSNMFNEARLSSRFYVGENVIAAKGSPPSSFLSRYDDMPMLLSASPPQLFMNNQFDHAPNPDFSPFLNSISTPFTDNFSANEWETADKLIDSFLKETFETPHSNKLTTNRPSSNQIIAMHTSGSKHPFRLTTQDLAILEGEKKQQHLLKTKSKKKGVTKKRANTKKLPPQPTPEEPKLRYIPSNGTVHMYAPIEDITYVPKTIIKM